MTDKTLREAAAELLIADEAYSKALSASGMANVSALTEVAADRLSDAARARRNALREVKTALASPEQAEPVAKCPCKDRAASACPGEWEPGCDLGNNPAHVRVSQQSPDEVAATLRKVTATQPAAPVGQVPFEFTACELADMARNPTVLAALMSYHEACQTEADACWDAEDCPTGNEARRQRLYERGRSIMAEDLDIWPDALRKTFGFPPFATAPTAPAPATDAGRHPFQGYIDSYRSMAKMGDGRVPASAVALDIERNMRPVTPPPPAAQPADPISTSSMTAERLKDALSNNRPLNTDQRSVLFQMVMEADALGKKYDADIAKLQAAAQPVALTLHVAAQGLADCVHQGRLVADSEASEGYVQSCVEAVEAALDANARQSPLAETLALAAFKADSYEDFASFLGGVRFAERAHNIPRPDGEDGGKGGAA